MDHISKNTHWGLAFRRRLLSHNNKAITTKTNGWVFLFLNHTALKIMLSNINCSKINIASSKNCVSKFYECTDIAHFQSSQLLEICHYQFCNNCLRHWQQIHIIVDKFYYIILFFEKIPGLWGSQIFPLLFQNKVHLHQALQLKIKNSARLFLYRVLCLFIKKAISCRARWLVSLWLSYKHRTISGLQRVAVWCLSLFLTPYAIISRWIHFCFYWQVGIWLWKERHKIQFKIKYYNMKCYY